MEPFTQDELHIIHEALCYVNNRDINNEKDLIPLILKVDSMLEDKE